MKFSEVVEALMMGKRIRKRGNGMTFVEVFNDLMRGDPVTRTSWVADDENCMMYYDLTSKSFVKRWAPEQYETQCKFICITHEDMSANDWEVCEWEDTE